MVTNPIVGYVKIPTLKNTMVATKIITLRREILGEKEKNVTFNLDIPQMICLGTLTTFIIGGFILPALYQLGAFIWAFIDDGKVGLNKIHELYFNKVLGCNYYPNYRNPWRGGSKWLSSETQYDTEEFYWHHFFINYSHCFFIDYS